jgi:hypothetical protein
MRNFESWIDADAGNNRRSAGARASVLEINGPRRARRQPSASTQPFAPCVGLGPCRNGVETAKCPNFALIRAWGHIGLEDIDWPSWRVFFQQGKSPRAAIERALERDL